MFAVIILLLVIVLYVIRLKWRRSDFLEKLSKFEGPSTVPLLGNALQFAKSPKGIYRYLHELPQRFRDPFIVWFFHKPFIVIHTPEEIKTVSKLLQKGDNYIFLSDVVGDGLLTAKPEKWKKHRNIINPVFNTTVLSDYFMEIYHKHARKLIKLFESEADTGSIFNIWLPHLDSSANMLYETIMGSDKNVSCKEGFSECRKNLDKACEFIAKRLYSPWLYPNIIFKAYLYLNGGSNVFLKTRAFHLKTLQERRKEFNELENAENKNYKQAKCMINVLLNFREVKDLTDDELTDEILTIIHAGTDTSAITECFTILMLAMRHEIQDRVHAELVQVFGECNRMPTMTDLSKLVFLEQCIKESLRLFSVAPLVIRHTTEEIALKDDLIIPADVDVVVAMSLIHHNPDFYPDPQTWNPEHFDPQNVANRPSGCFIPFGVGPRICIGNKFAMLKMKTILSTILRNFKVSTFESHVELKVDAFFMKSEKGYPVTLKYRHENSIFY